MEKLKKIFPLLKKGSKSDINNFRPNALLPIFRKIIEKHVNNCLTTYLKVNNILSEHQFGFKRSHSTSDALLAVVKECAFAMNDKKKCALVSIDLKKAFDVVNHNILLKKLENIGCDEHSLNWFQSYLKNRFQFVINNNKVSNILNNPLSVGQGTVLAPTLFSIFIDSITRLELNGKILLFADDMSLIVTAKNYSELEIKINSDLNKIYNWLLINELVPNFEKSNYIIMGCPRNDIILNITLGEKTLEMNKKTKVLGVVIDSQLKFDSHIEEISHKISNKISFFSRIRHILPKYYLNFLYQSLVSPLFDYCDVVWGHTYDIHLNKLYVLQRRAARVMTFSNFDEHSEELFKDLNWMTIEKRIKFHSILYIYKSLNGLNSNNSNKFFEFTSHYSRRTSDRLKLKVPNIKLNFLANTLFFKGIKAYNELPFNLRNLQNFRKFKTELMKIFS